MSIKVQLFDSQGEDREIDLTEVDVNNISEDKLLLIEVKGDDEAEVNKLSEILNLHRSSVKKLIKPECLPNLYNHNNYFQIEAVAVKKDEKKIYRRIPISFVVGKNWVLTKYKEEIDYLAEFWEAEAQDDKFGRLSAESFVASLLDWHLSTYFKILTEIEEKVDKIDERILTDKYNERFLEELSALRRTISELRGVLMPHQNVFYALIRPNFNVTSEFDFEEFYNNLKDRFERLADSLENSRNLVLSSFDLFATKTAHRTNELVKVLTFATLLIGTIGVAAGILGMNFELDFFKSGYPGFLTVLGGMGTFIIGSIIWAKMKGWL